MRVVVGGIVVLSRSEMTAIVAAHAVVRMCELVDANQDDKKKILEGLANGARTFRSWFLKVDCLRNFGKPIKWFENF